MKLSEGVSMLSSLGGDVQERLWSAFTAINGIVDAGPDASASLSDNDLCFFRCYQFLDELRRSDGVGLFTERQLHGAIEEIDIKLRRCGFESEAILLEKAILCVHGQEGIPEDLRSRMLAVDLNHAMSQDLLRSSKGPATFRTDEIRSRLQEVRSIFMPASSRFKELFLLLAKKFDISQ